MRGAPAKGKRRPKRVTGAGKARVREIVRRLHGEYGAVRCYLDYADPFQLLVSTILSAQCTDAKVNEVSPRLFKRYPDAAAMARARVGTLEGIVKQTGFFRMKARSIKAAAAALAKDHGGSVPATMDGLVALPGVGRKTASVVLGNAFGIPAIAVDTHVLRVAARLGLSREKTSDRMEQDLLPAVEEKDRTRFSLLVTTHGRRTCVAGKPFCSRCPIRALCRYRGPSR